MHCIKREEHHIQESCKKRAEHRLNDLQRGG